MSKLGLQASIGDFLLDIFPACLNLQCFDKLILLLRNLFEYHYDEMDPTSVHDLVTCVAHTCSISFEPADVTACLNLLETLIVTNNVQPAFLAAILGALCRATLIDQFMKPCLRLVELLINSPHRGLLVVTTLCKIMRDPRFQTSINLLRGAVFMLSHASWGMMRLDAITVRPGSVMGAFCVASNLKHSEVNFEIVLSLHTLITKRGGELDAAVWDAIIQVLTPCSQLCDGEDNPQMSTTFDTVLQALETLYAEGDYRGDEDELFTLLESHPGDRDMTITMDYKMKTVHPSVTGWMNNVVALAQRYFLEESRSSIKIRTLSILEDTMRESKHLYEDQLIEVVILKYFSDISNEVDPSVQIAAVELLAMVAASCSSQYYDRLCDVIFNTLWNAMIPGVICSPGQQSIDENTVACLAQLFVARFDSASQHYALRPLCMITDFVKRRLALAHELEDVSVINKPVLDAIRVLASIRWTQHGLVIIVDTEGETEAESPFLRIVPQKGEPDRTPSGKIVGTDSSDLARGTGPGRTSIYELNPLSAESIHVALTNIYALFCHVLRPPVVWAAVGLVTEGLVSLLSTVHYEIPRTVDVCMVCRAVCTLITRCTQSGSGAVKLPPSEGRDAIICGLYDILSMLLVYKKWLISPGIRDDLGVCLQTSLRQFVEPCIRTLGAYVLELKTVRTLSSIISAMQQFRSNSRLKLPFLEFLSILGRLPELTKNLREEDYKGIFAIILESCDPSRSSTAPYLTSLANHVIAVWFLRLGLKQRRKYVTLITDQLTAGTRRAYDSSPERSGSSPPPKGVPELSPMVETCLDMMARYAFSDASENTSTKEQPALKRLFEGVARKSWVYGHTVVTVAATGSGWGEVTIRKSTGTVSWVSRLLNTGKFPTSLPHWTQAVTDISSVGPLEIGVGFDLQQPARAKLASTIAGFQVRAKTRPPSPELTGLRAAAAAEEASRDGAEGGDGPDKAKGSRRGSKEKGSKGSRPDLDVDFDHVGTSPSSTESALLRASQTEYKNSLPLNISGVGQRAIRVKAKPRQPAVARMAPLANSYDSEDSQHSSGSALSSSLASFQDQMLLHSQMGLMGTSPKEEGFRSQSTLESISGHISEKRARRAQQARRPPLERGSIESEESDRGRSTSDSELLGLGGTPSSAGGGEGPPPPPPPPQAARDKQHRKRRGSKGDRKGSKGSTGSGSTSTSTASSSTTTTTTTGGSRLSDDGEPHDLSKGCDGAPEKSASNAPPAVEATGAASGPGAGTSQAISIRQSPSKPAELGPRRSEAVSVPTRRLGIGSNLSTPGSSLDDMSIGGSPGRPRSEVLSGSPSRSRSRTLHDLTESVPVIRAARENDIAASLREFRRSASLSLATRPKFDTQSSADDRDSSQASFLFLQMNHMPFFDDQAVPLRENLSADGPAPGRPTDLERMLRVLDRVPAYHTHRIGVVYVGPGQCKSDAILRNECGSSRYVGFLASLGNLILLKVWRLRHCSHTLLFARFRQRRSRSAGPRSPPDAARYIVLIDVPTAVLCPNWGPRTCPPSTRVGSTPTAAKTATTRTSGRAT